MKPLTRYAPALEGGGPYAADYATMLEDERGSYYAKDEADARIAELIAAYDGMCAVSVAQTRVIAELEAELRLSDSLHKVTVQQRDVAWSRVANLESEIDVAREEADRRTREVEATYLVQRRLTEERDAERAAAERYRWLRLPAKPTKAMCDALRIGSRRDVPSDELCAVRYAALIAAIDAARNSSK